MTDHSLHHWTDTLLDRQIRGQLFHPATGLIYDYVTSRVPELRFHHLPTPEEIARSFPNPCGWSTGMEDCAINTGLMLCHLTERQEEDTDFAQALANGLLRCESTHGVRGFIVRGLLPDDRTSCYPNSSRDQVTVTTYSLWKLLQGTRTPRDLKASIRNCLCHVADYCEKTINLKDHNDYRRLDGGPAVVSDLWNCDHHEMLRLPMIYGIAYHASQDKHYAELLQEVLKTGLEQTLAMDPDSPDWWDMPLLQMQLSLSFFWESDLVPEIRPNLKKAMETAASIAERNLDKLLQQAKDFQGNWTELFVNWRTLPMVLRRETLAPDQRSAIFGGLTYMNPIFKESFASPNNLIRGIGNYLAVMAHCPGFPQPTRQLALTDEIFSAIHVEQLTAVGTVPLIYGYTKAQTINTRQGGSR